MRKRFSPMTSSCLLRLEEMTRLLRLEGEGYETLHGEHIYTAQQVAYVLDVSPTTVANLVREGRLKSMNLRRVIRFTEDDLMTFIGAKRETV
jgi:excisionase family DNA binding protein